MLSWRITFAPAAYVLVSGLVACGPAGAESKPTAHLRGTVLINGQPLPSDAKATVDFMPAAGGGQAHPCSAKIVDGKYDAPLVPQGKVNVIFNIGRLTGRMITEDGGSPFAEMEDLVPIDAQQGVSIVVGGDEEKNFDL